MSSFQASLLREKITFTDETDDSKSVSIRSNRLSLTLSKATLSEQIVIRCQNIHGALRMGAKTFLNFYRGGGPFSQRPEPHNWERQWLSVISDYDERYNDSNWVSVYINGNCVFSSKKMTYLGILEQYANLHKDNYENSIGTMEQALKETGKAIKIDNSTSVATVLTDEVDFLRCGVIHRTTARDTIFNFLLNGGDTRTNRISHAFLMASNFLEALNLRYLILNISDRIDRGELFLKSKEDRKMHEATRRQGDLNREIREYEALYSVRFRPERPEFFID